MNVGSILVEERFGATVASCEFARVDCVAYYYADVIGFTRSPLQSGSASLRRILSS